MYSCVGNSIDRITVSFWVINNFAFYFHTSYDKITYILHHIDGIKANIRYITPKNWILQEKLQTFHNKVLYVLLYVLFYARQTWRQYCRNTPYIIPIFLNWWRILFGHDYKVRILKCDQKLYLSWNNSIDTNAIITYEYFVLFLNNTLLKLCIYFYNHDQ